MNTENLNDFQKMKIWAANNITNNEMEKIIFPEEEKPKIKIKNHVFSDLEFFESNDPNSKSVYDILSKNCKTPYGKLAIKRILENPENNLNKIKERQFLINYFIQNKEFSNNIKSNLENIKNPRDIFWLWKSNQELKSKNNRQSDLDLLYDLVYFNIPIVDDTLNSSEAILGTLSIYSMFIVPAFAILGPVMFFIVPFIFLRKIGFEISFYDFFKTMSKIVFKVNFIPSKMVLLSMIVWFGLYFYNIYSLLNVTWLKNNISNVIHDKLRIANQIIKSSNNIKNKILFFSEEQKRELCNFNYDFSLDDLLLKETISLPSSIFRNKGCIFSTFWKLRNKLSLLEDRIRFLGFIDAYYTISEYLKSLELNNLPWTFSKYKRQRKLIEFWHPSILDKGKTPILNSLGTNKKTNMVIITGPNAGGKSTYVKSIFVNCILSQTFGIALAKKFYLQNLYQYIDTYFNVPDIEGKVSTFQAEMKRCYEFIENLKTLKKSDHSLVALDEVLTSTNFKEAVSGASSILRYISKNYKKVLCIVTTHYHCLAGLECDTIENYCVTVKKRNGNIFYPFKMKKGISNDHVALDLLEKEGFSKEIIKSARETYEKIQLPSLRFLNLLKS